MPYTSDWKAVEATNPKFGCPKCPSKVVSKRDWESSDGAHDDTQYRCDACEHKWWVEGPDY